jgi:hypothetical protein
MFWTGFRNAKVRFSSNMNAGIWHAEVLGISVEDSLIRDSSGRFQSTIRLLVGEEGIDGFTSDMQVPWSSGYFPSRLVLRIGYI